MEKINTAINHVRSKTIKPYIIQEYEKEMKKKTVKYIAHRLGISINQAEELTSASSYEGVATKEKVLKKLTAFKNSKRKRV